jgi:hypothetical protein
MTELNIQQIKELINNQYLQFEPLIDENGNILSFDLVRNNEFNKN